MDYKLTIILLITLYSCNNNCNEEYSPKQEPTYYAHMDTNIEAKYDSIMSSYLGVPLYQFGEKIYDVDNNMLYFSGYLNFQYPDKESKKVGNYVYNLNEGVIINSYVDSRKSERRIEDGDSNKSYINGVGRDFGVRLYAEYDDDDLKNKTAIFKIDTTCQSIALSVSRDKDTISSLELKNNLIIISRGIPLYTSTKAAFNDVDLSSGALFKTSNHDGTSQIHIKE